MSDTKSSLKSSAFKNGENIKFDYNNINGNILKPELTNNSSNKKKKKKKNKNKNKNHDMEATLNNPDDDYPTSRIIKQGPNGSVIVESMEETNDHAIGLNNPVTEIWFHNSTADERKELKQFWESLNDKEKSNLAKIKKSDLLSILRNDSNKSISNQKSNNLDKSQHRDLNQFNNQNCTCNHCGRKRNMIFNEIERMYDDYEEEIYEFINDVIDLNDLLGLPGHLFNNFNKLNLDNSKKNDKLLQLQQLQQHHQHLQQQSKDLQQHSKDLQQHSKDLQQHSKDLHQLSQNQYPESSSQSRNPHLLEDIDHSPTRNLQLQGHPLDNPQLHHQLKQNFVQQNMKFTRFKRDKPQLNDQGEKIIDENIDLESLNDNNGAKNKLISKFFDQKLYEAVKSLDLEKFKELPKENQADAIKGVTELKNFMNEVKSADVHEIQQSMNFLENIAKMFDIDINNPKHVSNAAAVYEHLNPNGKLSNDLTNLTDDIIQENGNHFINMMERISKSRDERSNPYAVKYNTNGSVSIVPASEEHPQGIIENGDLEVEEQPPYEEVIRRKPQFTREEFEKQYQEFQQHHQQQQLLQHQHQHQLQHQQEAHEHVHQHHYCGDSENEDDDEYDDDEDDDDYDYEENLEEELSNDESEISEEEKLQELRHLFLMQVIRVFRQRLKNAYKEKLSQDRAQKLIEELEAEENAKKERELKKLKQKEKAKEKKKLQQLAREEEKKRKEEEERAKKEEERRKTEKLQAEQRKRNEEYQRKKEEEKLRLIEEQQKKIESRKEQLRQKQQEEELKKKKLEEELIKKKEREERQKLINEERRKKEQELELKRQEEARRLREKEEATKLKKENAEQQRLENERSERARLEKERLERERLDKERLEKETKALEEAEAEALLKEQQEAANRFKEDNLAPILNPLIFNTGVNTAPNGTANSNSSTPKISEQWMASPFNQPALVQLLQAFRPFNTVQNLNSNYLLNDPFSKPQSSATNMSTTNSPPGLTSFNSQSNIALNGGLNGFNNITNNINNGINLNNGINDGIGTTINGLANGVVNGVSNVNPSTSPSFPPGVSPSLQRLSTGSLNTWGATPEPNPSANLLKLNTGFSSFSGNPGFNSNFSSGSLWNDSNQIQPTIQETNPAGALPPRSLSQSQPIGQSLGQPPSDINLQANPSQQPPDQVVLNAVCKAYHMLATSNQLWNGYAKIYPLFQTTVSILQQFQLEYHKFVSIITNQLVVTNYKFEFLYDNFQISLVKVGNLEQSPLLANNIPLRFNNGYGTNSINLSNLNNDMINFNHQL